MSHRAGFWIRTLAALLDLFAMTPVYFIATTVMLAVWERVGGRVRAEAIASAILLCGWLAYTSFEIWTAGTPGKLILRLRVKSADGTPADFWRKVLRWSTKQLPMISNLLFVLTAFGPFYLLSGFSSLVVLVGCLFAANDDHLTWHDQWSGTAVYRTAKPPSVDTPAPLA